MPATVERLSGRRFKVLVCRGPECGDKRDSLAIYERFREVFEDRGVAGDIELGWQSCFGRCTQGPNCLVREIVPQPTAQRFVFAALPSRRGLTALYNGVTRDDVADVTDRHIIGGQLVRRLIRRPELGASPERRARAASSRNETPETGE